MINEDFSGCRHTVSDGYVPSTTLLVDGSTIQQFNTAPPQPVTTLVVPAEDWGFRVPPQYLPTFCIENCQDLYGPVKIKKDRGIVIKGLEG